MTFEQTIAASVAAGNNYHIFSAFGSTTRGFYAGKKTLSAAKKLAAKLSDPIIYDNAGNDAEDTLAARNVD